MKNKLTDRIKENISKHKDKVLLGTALLTLGTSACAPQRMYLGESSSPKYQKVSEFTTDYVNREGTLDAAEANREVRVLNDFVKTGQMFNSEADLYKAMSSCVKDKRELDKWGYGIGATVIDGLKLYFLVSGMVGKSSGGGTKYIQTGPTVGNPSSGVTNIYSPIR